MRKGLVFILLLSSLVCGAQSNMSKPKSFYIAKEFKPPVLDIDQSSIALVEPSGNNAIDANENCLISFLVHNSGTGDGLDCFARISAEGSINGLTASNVQLNTIPAGKSVRVEVPVTSNSNTLDGNVVFTIQVSEAQGFGTEPFQLAVDTRKFEAPLVKVVDYSVTGASANAKLEKRIPFDLQLLLQNTQHGNAQDVQVSVSVPDGVLLLDESLSTRRFESLNGGETKSLVYPIIAMVNYNESTIPVEVKIREKFGKYAEDKTITLNLNQRLASTKIVVDSQEEERKSISIGRLTSVVDKNIPSSSKVNDKTFAVIIANEAYQNTANVPYAMNDGGVFRDYCKLALGIPSRNIHFVANATLNNIQGEVNWLENVLQSYEGQARAIFYYAGHGIPDEASKDSYLLPVDGIGSDVRTGYKLQNLYARLGSMPSESVTVFLDACFSGANRDGEMLNPNLRGVVIRANSAAPSGNMVVFSAAQGYETAMPLSEESHGMFTYFLLKKLQETAGDVTFEELSEYVQRNVRRYSSVLGKTQTPTVTPSSSLGDAWKGWKLK